MDREELAEDAFLADDDAAVFVDGAAVAVATDEDFFDVDGASEAVVAFEAHGLCGSWAVVGASLGDWGEEADTEECNEDDFFHKLVVVVCFVEETVGWRNVFRFFSRGGFLGVFMFGFE